jgi:transcriptional regulator with XRE-family HTH domain
MSTSAEHPEIPRFDQADRMRKALRTSGIGANEMAAYLDVSRNTVSNWINGHTPPRGAYLRLWALRTGVPFEWLEHGEVTPANDEGTRAATTRGSLGKLVTLGEVSAMNTLPAQSVTAAA